VFEFVYQILLTEELLVRVRLGHLDDIEGADVRSASNGYLAALLLLPEVLQDLFRRIHGLIVGFDGLIGIGENRVTLGVQISLGRTDCRLLREPNVDGRSGIHVGLFIGDVFYWLSYCLFSGVVELLRYIDIIASYDDFLVGRDFEPVGVVGDILELLGLHRPTAVGLATIRIDDVVLPTAGALIRVDIACQPDPIEGIDVPSPIGLNRDLIEELPARIVVCIEAKPCHRPLDSCLLGCLGNQILAIDDEGFLTDGIEGLLSRVLLELPRHFELLELPRCVVGVNSLGAVLVERHTINRSAGDRMLVDEQPTSKSIAEVL